MRRIDLDPRPDWQQKAEAAGFDFHTPDGAPYWDESHCYAFTLAQIENDIEAPTGELHDMVLDMVGDIVGDERLLCQLDIPEAFWGWVAESWRNGEPHLYGRMDFAYDGTGPAKLLELNYDTPTSLFEAAFFQWQWLDDMQQRGTFPLLADQYNAIYETLVEAFSLIAKRLQRPLYFAAVRGSSEDQGTIGYLRDCAMQAGIECGALAMEDIGLTADGRYTDLADNTIGTLAKLYPLEDLMREPFGEYLPASGMQLLEPAWKAVLSNKGILPLLWQRHRGHPNLLPAEFVADSDTPPPPGWVVKPLYSREGANIRITLPDGRSESAPGPYQGACIRQAFQPLAEFAGDHVVLGSWVVGDRPCGLGLRADRSRITRDSARFVPHVILEETGGVLLA